MALTKEKKNAVVEEVSSLLANSKMTVMTAYKGTPVKALQQLRRQARDNGTTLQVVKNRLVIKALQSSDTFKDIDTKLLTGMILYGFNSTDEVAPAQIIANFAKTQPTLEFVGAITAEGKFLDSTEVKALASLPSKTQLIAGVLNTLNSPVNGVISGLGGNLAGLIKALEQKASN